MSKTVVNGEVVTRNVLVGVQGPPGAPGSDGSDGAPGVDGREVELQKDPTHIHWRHEGEAGWTNLVPLADITGPPGDLSSEDKNVPGGIAGLDVDGYATAIRGAVDGRPFGVVSVTEFGATGDGSTDDSASVQAAIDAVQTAGGGTVYFPPGVYLITQQLTFNDDNGTPNPAQASVHLAGPGGTQMKTGLASVPSAGAVLDLRYEGADAKIMTRGKGLLEISGLTLANNAEGGATAFIKTTQTSLNIHDNYFWGSPGRERQSCEEDGIILGGLATGIAGFYDNTNDSGFNGYSTFITRNVFHRIRRVMLGQAHANSVVFAQNSMHSDCGSNLAGGAAVELNPGTETGAICWSNVIADNLIEVTGYVYGIKLMNNTRRTVIRGNGFWDDEETYLADVYIDTNAEDNLIHLDGIGSGVVADNTPEKQNAIWVQGGGNLKLYTPQLDVRGQFNGATTLMVTGPETPVSDYFRVRKADTTVLWSINKDGQLVINGSAFGTTLPVSIVNNTAGNSTAEFRNSTRTGVRFGGGSHIQLMSGAGAVQCFIQAGSGDPEGSVTANPGSLYLRTSGGAGTTLYVKESGTGNTGWVGK